MRDEVKFRTVDGEYVCVVDWSDKYVGIGIHSESIRDRVFGFLLPEQARDLGELLIQRAEQMITDGEERPHDRVWRDRDFMDRLADIMYTGMVRGGRKSYTPAEMVEMLSENEQEWAGDVARWLIAQGDVVLTDGHRFRAVRCEEVKS